MSKLEQEFPKEIKNPGEVFFSDIDEIVMVICDGKVFKSYESVSLEEIKKRCGFRRGIVVIAEGPFKGRIFRYGSYGQRWDEIGSTCGYA